MTRTSKDFWLGACCVAIGLIFTAQGGLDPAGQSHHAILPGHWVWPALSIVQIAFGALLALLAVRACIVTWKQTR